MFKINPFTGKFDWVITDHGGLSGLGDDDHPQYLLSATAVTTYVPYTGATGDVNLGTHSIRADEGFWSGITPSPTTGKFDIEHTQTAADLYQLGKFNLSRTTASAGVDVALFVAGLISTGANATGGMIGVSGQVGLAASQSGQINGNLIGVNFLTRLNGTAIITGNVIGSNGVISLGANSSHTAPAVYGALGDIEDGRTTSLGGSITDMALVGAVDILGYYNVTTKRGFWGNYTNTVSQGVVTFYGIELNKVAQGTTTNIAIQLDGTAEAAQGIRWGYDGDAANLYKGAAGTVKTDGSFSASQLISTIAIGTAPLTITSTTKVTNLNADLLDDQTGSYYLDATNFTGTNWTDLTDGGNTTLHTHTASVAKGEDYTLLSADVGKTYYNTAAIVLTLPTGVDGYRYRFIVQHNSYLKILAVGTDVIRYIDTVSAAAGYFRSDTVGNTCEMEFANGTWFIHSLEAKESSPWLVDV